jgi:hypothetical protein
LWCQFVYFLFIFGRSYVEEHAPLITDNSRIEEDELSDHSLQSPVQHAESHQPKVAPSNVNLASVGAGASTNPAAFNGSQRRIQGVMRGGHRGAMGMGMGMGMGMPPAMGMFPFPPGPGRMPPMMMPGARAGASRRPRCIDFEQKGRCDRGDSCPFEHDSPLVYEVTQLGMPGPRRGMPFPGPAPGELEYNPENPSQQFAINAPGMPMIPPMFPNFQVCAIHIKIW